MGTGIGAVSRFDGSRWTHSLRPDTTRWELVKVAIDGQGRVWNASMNQAWTSGNGVARLLEDGSWKAYSAADLGITGPTVNALAIDTAGHLWMTTLYGILEFDGQGWINHGRAGGYQPALVISGKGEVRYINTGKYGSSVSALSGGTWKGVWYNPNGRMNGLFIHDMIVTPEGEFWSTTNAGLRRHRDSVETIFDLPADRLAPGIRSGVWIAANNKVVHYTDTLGSAYPLSDLPGAVTAIRFDPQGHPWMLASGHLIRPKPKGWAWEVVPAPSNSVYSGMTLADDGRGGFLVGHSQGVAAYSDTGWVLFQPRAGEPTWSRHVERIAVSREGGSWYANTLSEGLVRQRGNAIDRFDSSNSSLSGARVKEILADSRAGIWVSQEDGGLHRYDGNRWKRMATLASGYEAPVRRLALDASGNLWGITSRELFVLAGATLHGFNPPLSGADLAELSVDGNGVKWVLASGQGLLRFENGSWASFTRANAGLPSDTLTTVAAAPNGDLWLGWSGGAVAYDRTEIGSLKTIQERSFPSLSISGGTWEFWSPDSMKPAWISARE